MELSEWTKKAQTETSVTKIARKWKKMKTMNKKIQRVLVKKTKLHWNGCSMDLLIVLNSKIGLIMRSKFATFDRKDKLTLTKLSFKREIGSATYAIDY